MEEKKQLSVEITRILDDGEEVLLSVKPNKKRFVYLNILVILLICAIPMLPCLIIGFLGLFDVIKFTDATGAKDWIAPIGFTIFGFISLLMGLLFIVVGIVRFGKTAYFVTNKRLILQTGFIGVDFKSLPLENVSASAVRVGLVDKFCHPNTGTLLFGSAASPIYDNRNGNAQAFGFYHVDEPYELYKKVKAYLKPKGE